MNLIVIRSSQILWHRNNTIGSRRANVAPLFEKLLGKQCCQNVVRSDLTLSRLELLLVYDYNNGVSEYSC
jgi:hypothetical protein